MKRRWFAVAFHAQAELTSALSTLHSRAACTNPVSLYSVLELDQTRALACTACAGCPSSPTLNPSNSLMNRPQKR